MTIYDVKFWRGMEMALHTAGVDYQSLEYEIAHEVAGLRNIKACPLPVSRKWDRPKILRQFRIAIERSGTAKDLLEEMIRPIAAKGDFGNQYWVHRGEDAGQGYCGKCIDAAVRHQRKHGYPEATRDGGWGNEVDYPQWCDGCGVYLDETILQYEEEIQRLSTSGLDATPEDCAIALQCVDNGSDDFALEIHRIALWFFARFPEHRPKLKRKSRRRSAVAS